MCKQVPNSVKRWTEKVPKSAKKSQKKKFQKVAKNPKRAKTLKKIKTDQKIQNKNKQLFKAWYRIRKNNSFTKLFLTSHKENNITYMDQI